MNTVSIKVAFFALITICLSICYSPTNVNANSGSGLLSKSLIACEIFNLTATPQPCTPNGVFYVEIDFDVAGDPSDLFTVAGNGNDYGTFNYNQLPVMVGPLEGDGVTIYEFVVTDIQDSNCSDFAVIDPVSCDIQGDCDITELVIDPLDCNDNGTYNIFINFQYENPGNDFFEVFNANNESIGFFPLNELPVIVQNFEPSGNDFDVVTVCINDMPNCCATQEFPAPDCPILECQISNVVAEPGACDGMLFWVTLNFDYENTSDQFSVHGNGTDYGDFNYNELPVTIGPLVGDGVTVYEFVVTDLEHPNCSDFTVIEPVQCNVQACEIWDLIAEIHDCDGEFFLVDLTFNFENTSDSFEVHGNGNNYGTFAYTDLFITLGPFEGNGQNLEFVVVDQQNEDCNAEVVIEAPYCPGVDCEIWNIVAEAHDCDGDFFLLDINFSYENTSDSFVVFGNGNNYGTFAYADLFITLGPFEGNGQVLEFIVFDQQNDNCNAELVFETPNCLDDCEIWDLVAEVGDCNPNEIFYVTLNFNFENTSDSFEVHGNGNNYGTFAYNDLPFTLGPFPGNGQILEFVVVDQQSEDCHDFVVIEAPNCGNNDCDIFELNVDPLECNDNGTYSIAINFQYENPGNDFFEVFNANNESIGFFPLNELPVVIQNFEPSGNNFDVITVCINDMPNCCATTEFEALDCPGNNCEIWDLIVEPYECDGEFFMIDLTFNYQNTSDSFEVHGNGNNYGTFSYEDLFITLGPFPGNGQILEFVVVDQQSEDCHDFVVIEAPNCGNNDCDIFELNVDPLECNDNGTYSISINFQYENPGNDFFEVFNANNESIGFFPLSQLPVIIQNFEPSGNNFDVITVCINDMPNCCATTEFEALDCPGNNCEIWDLIVEPYECDGDFFMIDLTFNYQNTSDSFEVHGNGNNYGTFSYEDLFITLGPFEGNGQTLEFVVVDQQSEDCHDFVVIEAPNCGNNDCDIFELNVDPLECNDNGTYSIAINFGYENPGNDFFEVFNANNESIGFFPLNELPVVIQNFEPSGNNFDVITVCINDMPNCCATTEFEALDCDDDCHIYDLVAEAFCDGDDLFVQFSFEYSGVSDHFNVLACNYLATFEYGQNSYVIQIPDDEVDCAGGIFFPFAVFDQEFQDCGDAVEIEIPDCYNTGCIIGPIESEISDCESGDFFVTLNFDYQDVSDLGFQVFGNGNNYGEFDYNDLPITLGPFEANGQEMEFIIIDLVFEDCWNFIEIEAPFCTEDANTCIEFESLYNGVNYGGSNSTPGDLLLIENGVYVTIEGVMDPLGNLNYDYLFATNQDICSPFETASGIRMFMFNGLRFDFTELDENPGIVVFNYHNCGYPFAISANDQLPVTYVLPENDYTFALTPAVTVSFDVDENNPDEGIATFEGNIETIFAGGVEFQIDNVCFDVDDNLTDVWPGDANYDNTANHFDLLNVGIAFGQEGPERDVISNDWFAMTGEDWEDFFQNEANYKHADCNGDGQVNFDDKVAILENYNLTHGEVPIFVPVEGTPNNPALFVDLPEASEIQLNEPFEAPIVLGTTDIPVEEIYGLAFTIEFDPGMMNESEVHIELGSSWLGVNGESLITLNKKFAPEGIIEVALTRNNQANISGQGTIGYFIGIIDDILGKTEVQVKIKKVKAITLNEMPVPLYTPVEIVDLATGIDIIPAALDLEVFPNPAHDVLNIHFNGTEPMQSIRIYNTLGQLMTEFSEPNPHQIVDVSRWAAGIYFVKIEIGTYTFCEKIKVTRL